MLLGFIHASDGVSILTKFDGHIYHGYPVNAKVCPLYNVLWECIVVVYI